MGDRALIQFENGIETSPAIYLHWDGNYVEDRIAETKRLMEGRSTDLAYVTARFIGVCHSHIDGNLSLGVWNASYRLTPGDSHGDRGCYVIDISTPDWKVDHFK